jgi:hypothetical protein
MGATQRKIAEKIEEKDIERKEELFENVDQQGNVHNHSKHISPRRQIKLTKLPKHLARDTPL